MITKEFAKKQVFRMSGMLGFPSNTEAILELVLAIQAADSPKTAEDWVSGFLEDSTAETRCPSPGDIRRALQARQQAKRTMRACVQCDGTGWVTVWRLVTFRAGTYKMLKSEVFELPVDDGTLASVPEKFIQEFRKKLGPDQDILSAAKPCVCLPPGHKYLTGERQ